MTWAAANSDVGYKQGMHELVAVLLMLVVRDSRRRAIEEYEMRNQQDDNEHVTRLRKALNVILDFEVCTKKHWVKTYTMARRCKNSCPNSMSV